MSAPGFDIDSDPKTIVTAFFDDQKALDTEALRQFVLKKLEDLGQRYEHCMNHPECGQFWQHQADRGIATADQPTIQGCQEVQELGAAIDFWRSQAVESPQRWNFFVLEKATEISSGDRDRDYYHALLIRHDQILAACLVLEQAVSYIEQSCQLAPVSVTQDNVVSFFSNQEVETRIFQQAEQLFQTRKELGIL